MHPGGQSAKVAELINLQWDGEPREGSLDHVASVALPYFWQRARFVARKKRVGQERRSELTD